jgi:hypothetical protein
MVTPEAASQAKARALAQRVQVWVLEPGKRYVALSSTNDGIAYEVIIRSQEQNDITCSCPGATYRGICQHIGKIMLMLEADQLQVNDDLEVEDGDAVLQLHDHRGKEVNDHLQVHDHLEQDIADLYYR